jgi:hypothetical protein
VLAVIDARTAEARGIDLQQAERAMPSGKWVLSPAPPKFFVYGTKTSKRAGRVCAVTLAFRAVGAVRVCVSSLVCWVLGVGAGGPHKTTRRGTLASRIAGQCVIIIITISCRLVRNRICRLTIR